MLAVCFPAKERILGLERKIMSPCIGVCSTGIGDVVCRGCKRFCHEVIHWNSYTDKEKQAINERLSLLLTQVVKARVVVLDEQQLRAQIEHQQIRCHLGGDPHRWVFDLLKAGAAQIRDIGDYGLALLPEYAEMSATALRDDIDRDFFILSQAHYQRYFQ